MLKIKMPKSTRQQREMNVTTSKPVGDASQAATCKIESSVPHIQKEPSHRT